MGLPKSKEYWTVEEYLEFEKTSPVRHGYVDGEIYAMAGESKNHKLQSEIHFDSIGVKVSLADIYRRVRFSENILEMEREE